MVFVAEWRHWGFSHAVDVCSFIYIYDGFAFQGFRYVASGPMVRSSFKAGEYFIKSMIDEDRERQKIAAIE